MNARSGLSQKYRLLTHGPVDLVGQYFSETRLMHFTDVMEKYEQRINDEGREWTRSRAKQKPDMNAAWPQLAVSMWLYSYNAIVEVNVFRNLFNA